jgi:hypothetical protein
LFGILFRPGFGSADGIDGIGPRQQLLLGFIVLMTGI